MLFCVVCCCVCVFCCDGVEKVCVDVGCVDGGVLWDLRWCDCVECVDE